MKLLIGFLFLLSLFFNLVLGPCDAAGTSSASVLLKPPSAIAAGLSEALCSVSADISGITTFHYNPAAPAFMEKPEISLMGQRGWMEDTLMSTFVGIPTDWGTYSGDMTYYSLGNIQLIDSLGQSRTVQAEQDFLVNLNFAEHLYESYGTGFSIKFLQNKLVDNLSSNAIAIDFGAQAKPWNKNLSLGLAIQNIGSKLTFVSVSESIPFIVRGGISYNKPLNPLLHSGWSNILAGMDFVKELDQPVKTFLGLELFWNESVALRFGYKSGQDLGKLSYGAGFVIGDFQINYGLTDGGDLGKIHSVSISYQFENGKKVRWIRKKGG